MERGREGRMEGEMEEGMEREWEGEMERGREGRMEGEMEGGIKEWMEGGMEGEWEEKWEEGMEGGMDGRREGRREGGREGAREEGGREGGREGRREGGREGGSDTKLDQVCACVHMHAGGGSCIYQLTMPLMSSSMVAMITQNTYHSSDVISAKVSTTLDHVHAHVRCAEKEGVVVSSIILSIPTTTTNYPIMRGAGKLTGEANSMSAASRSRGCSCILPCLID